MDTYILDDIRFNGRLSPQSVTRASGPKLAQLDVVGGKPDLQKTGENLAKIELEVYLSFAFCDPAAVIEQFRTKAADAVKCPFTTGAGEDFGVFVVQAVEVTERRRNHLKELVEADLKIQLIETKERVDTINRGTSVAENTITTVRVNALPALPPEAFMQDLYGVNSESELISREVQAIVNQGVGGPSASRFKKIERAALEAKKKVDRVLGIIGNVQTFAGQVAAALSRLEAILEAVTRVAANAAEGDLTNTRLASGDLATAANEMIGFSSGLLTNLLTRRPA